MELLVIPIVAALLVLALRGETSRWAALVAALAALAVTALKISTLSTDGALSHLTEYTWIQRAGISFKVGIDGISAVCLLLTALLVPIIILTSFSRKFDNPSRFYSLVLLMQAGLFGVFMALDGFLFYVSWELTLIPIYFICAIWGGENRIRITLKFFIYTFAGSLLMLLSLIYLYLKMEPRGIAPSFDLGMLMQVAQMLPLEKQLIVLLGFFIAFAIKMPVFPFHTWQPDTYTVAPAAGTMLLSGIMLKMGLYGVIRWMIPLAPLAFAQYGHYMIVLAIIGVVYGAVIAIRQDDMKRLVAYSSISHVGLIAAGLMTFSLNGLQGGLVQMLAHGINIVGLFYAIDIIERRTNTRSLAELGGIAKSAPKFAVLFLIILLGSVAVPLTNGFVGEFLLLQAVYAKGFWWAAVAGLTVIFCAVYMLLLYQKSMFGKPNANTEKFEDVNVLEFTTLAVIAGLVLVFGVFPQPLLDLTAGSVNALLNAVPH